MGVSGSGKTTVGQALADRLGLPCADADSFHSEASVAKMASGHPLDDDDRAPWLVTVGAWLAGHADSGAVVGCSALRRRYRDVLRQAAPDVVFLHLTGDPAVLAARVANRPGHFMPASLIESQLSTLEPLEADERGTVLDLGAPVDDLVSAFVQGLG
ncbi:gluconokinase [Pengzhenrongella frigida]|uniref:Gluconokinase n=2 Tax=Pengzhenrongella frigida TaxID=1259133 RepID=A0A4Q5MW25_9MICO|nr:gluconokinase [Cellulomonas sp. HLT2-17]